MQHDWHVFTLHSIMWQCIIEEPPNRSHEASPICTVQWHCKGFLLCCSGPSMVGDTVTPLSIMQVVSCQCLHF